MYINIIFVILLTVLISRYFLRSIVAMLSASNNFMYMKENYRKKPVPSIGGIAYIPLLLIISLLLSPIMPVYDEKGILFMFIMSCIGFIGLLDDLLGDKSTKGIKGHIKKTVSGMPTTGILKALTGVALAYIASVRISSDMLEFVLNMFIISLFTNTINLLDLRPGRAVKSFLIVSVILILLNAFRVYVLIPLLILHVVSWVYIEYDLSEECMLGDTGSNILGITLGYYSALLLSFNCKMLLLVVLITLNILSERVSITEIINKNRFLSYLDNLGRS